MDRRGFSTLFVAAVVVVLIVTAIGYFFVYPAIQKNSSQDMLQDSDISGLATFLQQSGMEAAVVEKLYQSNYDSVWLVKKDGEKILIAKQDLGAYVDKKGLFEPHAFLVTQQFSKGDVALLPDDAQIYSLISGMSYNISSYLNGYAVSSEWSDPALQKYLGVVYTEDTRLYSSLLSPDGKHLLAGNYGYIPFNELMTISSYFPDPTLVPVARTPLDRFSAWSVDGQYFLGSKTQNPNPDQIYPSSTESVITSVGLGSYVYDINSGVVTPVGQKPASFMSHEFPDFASFSHGDINVIGLIPDKT